jgi:hypothetical protein|tara:strand:+ start:690 stop:1151 length:462 start_codon:yes stop_codon:yes gene_type:complete
MIQCRSCQRLKEEDDFYLRADGINRFNRCKSCISKETAEQKRKIYKWVDNHKASMGCDHCGETDKRCLQLHHKDSSTKKHSVATLIGKGYIFKTVKIEVEKCEVLCANCHSIHHYDERRSGSWGAGSYTEKEEVDECSPVVEQLELFLNFVEE